MRGVWEWCLVHCSCGSGGDSGSGEVMMMRVALIMMMLIETMGLVVMFAK